MRAHQTAIVRRDEANLLSPTSKKQDLLRPLRLTFF